MNKYIIPVLASALVLAVGCGKKEEPKKPVEAPAAVAKESMLAAKVVRDLVTGNTLHAVPPGGGETYKFFHAKNGAALGVDGYGRKGKWRVTESGQYCLELEGKKENCWSFAKDGKGTYTLVNSNLVPVWVISKIQPGKP